MRLFCYGPAYVYLVMIFLVLHIIFISNMSPARQYIYIINFTFIYYYHPCLFFISFLALCARIFRVLQS